MTKNPETTTIAITAEEELVAVVPAEEVMVAEDEAVAMAEAEEATEPEGMRR